MMTTHPTIAVIGAGNMGSALISGLIAHHHPMEKICASDPSPEKLQQLQQIAAISTTRDNKEAAQNAQIIIFAVKPLLLSSVAKEIAPQVQAQESLIISIAAGVREASLLQWLGNKTAIVRCMPNIPAAIGCGASALYANAYVSPEQRRLAEFVLQCVGITVWLDEEKQMDAVTALSGSGPAYFFLMMEAMQQAAEDLGLSAETARLLTIQTAYGAARLAQESKTSAAELRQQVTSPGGTTESALKVLEKGNFKHLITQALSAAKNRAEELATEEE